MPEQQKLDRFGVAAALQEIAQLMELKGGQYRFKAKAYNAGARAIQGVADLVRLVKEDRLTTLPRIGDALASQIKQLYLTGESSVLNELKTEFPQGTTELSAVPGLTIAKVKQLQDELGIKSVEELKSAAEEGRLKDLKGFGAKTEQRLLKSIETEKTKPKRRLHINHAWNTGERLLEYVSNLAGVIELSLTGALRRREENIERVEV